jgi:hypothetical protein
MKLIDELIERHSEVEQRIDARNAQISEHLHAIDALVAVRTDLDRAIAALNAFTNEDDHVVTWTEDQKPETWETMERAEQGEVKTVLLATGAANAVYTAEDEVFADAYAAEIISDLTGDPAVEPESGLHGEAVSEDGYAPVTNPEADAAARALAYYSPAEQRARAAPWPGLGTLWGKPKVDA